MTIQNEDYELQDLKEKMNEYVKNKELELIAKNDPRRRQCKTYFGK